VLLTKAADRELRPGVCGRLRVADHLLSRGPVLGEDEDFPQTGYREDTFGYCSDTAKNELTPRIVQQASEYQQITDIPGMDDLDFGQINNNVAIGILSDDIVDLLELIRPCRAFARQIDKNDLI
jgi:hypothetical protein